MPRMKRKTATPPTTDDKVVNQKSGTTVEVKTLGVKALGHEIGETEGKVKYALVAGAKYNPRVSHTIEAWTKVQNCLGTKGATYADLCKALAQHFTKADENHHDFIGYMVRRGTVKVVSK